ncbi:hypothetical protein TUSST3_30350 [Streptomyces sp. TUS-ST3]|nr:hypothetical protein TUSST3_30350 [Streptomyces sp. TUS-ST3]
MAIGNEFCESSTVVSYRAIAACADVSCRVPDAEPHGRVRIRGPALNRGDGGLISVLTWVQP